MALVKAHAAGSIFAKINPDIRLYLLGGEVEGQCRHLRDTLAASLGPDAEAEGAPILLADQDRALSSLRAPPRSRRGS